MTNFATAVLLASSLISSSLDRYRTADVEPNQMLRNAAVDHDLARVKRRIEQDLHIAPADGSGASHR